MVMVGASSLVTKGRVSISVAQASRVVSLPLEVYQSSSIWAAMSGSAWRASVAWKKALT